MVGANPSHRIAPDGSPELSALAGAINAFADQHQRVLHDVEARIGDANRRIQEERNRLAALVSDLAQSVLVCNGDGRILLYNERARALLEPTQASGGVPGASLVGLGRSVFAFFDRSLVTHALEKIWTREQKGEERAVASFVTTIGGGRLVRLQVAPVRGAAPDGAAAGAPGEPLGGFVLVFEDVTPAVEAGSRTGVALERLIDTSRRALGSIRAAVETLLSFPAMPPDKQGQFMAVIGEEAASLTAALERAAAAHGSSPSSEWLLEEMAAADLVSAIASRIERELGMSAETAAVDPELWLKADSYALVQAITRLARRVRDELEVREVRLRLDGAGRHANLDLAWAGPGIPPGAFSRWESERADGAFAASLKEIVDRHGGEAWSPAPGPGHDGFVRVLLPVTRRAPATWRVTPRVAGRPEFYDFDLFHQAGQSAELDERRLAELTYTVFDTETTGLQPSEGDEIVCIGAVRIVNGRLLRHEAYEQFIDPRRPLSRESIQITGIDPDMLSGQPTIDRVLPEFHRFCEDTVLVAHNAAFDLRFLQLKEASAGVRFTHPVLDTLLLSAAVQPQGALQLEALAERLGVPLIGRHTALGDAIMTGEILLRLLPLLSSAGILTLKHAREASERTFRARIRY
jgi:DNA polymerase-3 subunit epsilon